MPGMALAPLAAFQSTSFRPLVPQTMYSQSLRKRPGMFRLMPLSQTMTPRHTQPAIWIASVMAGRFRQSMKAAMVPPSLVNSLSSMLTWVINWMKLCWSMLSPEKLGKRAAPLKSASVYLTRVSCLRSPANRPPLEYGGFLSERDPRSRAPAAAEGRDSCLLTV